MEMTLSEARADGVERRWPGYRTVWRWHFYAGLFCIPFVIWLSVTGAIYLFKPQIEAWLDRSYDHLTVTGTRATPQAHVTAALASVPGSVLNGYELPTAPDSAVRVLVGKGADVYRVYVHPETSAVLGSVLEEDRFMRWIFLLHGELKLGPRGSLLVELAASWAVVMIITGLFLWWPRKRGVAGVLYPRMNRQGRVMWRDIHAVAGVWVSFYTLFLLLSGLPWAKSWGNLLKEARQVGNSAVVSLDWSTGSDSEKAARVARNSRPRREGGHGGHGAHSSMASSTSPDEYTPLNALVPVVTSLNLDAPVSIAPPSDSSAMWTAASETANRPRRASLVLDGATGAVVSRTDFGQRPMLDRIIGIGVAAHEGQLFGLANQIVGLMATLGLILVSVSAVVLWWQRREPMTLGAPDTLEQRPPLPLMLFVLIGTLGLVLPMLGLSLIVVLLLERILFRRLAPARTFLGLKEAV